MTGRGTQHKTKSKESITICNLQGTRFLLTGQRESKSNKWKKGEETKEPAVEQVKDTAVGYSEMEMSVRSVCLH